MKDYLDVTAGCLGCATLVLVLFAIGAAMIKGMIVIAQAIF